MTKLMYGTVHEFCHMTKLMPVSVFCVLLVAIVFMCLVGSLMDFLECLYASFVVFLLCFAFV